MTEAEASYKSLLDAPLSNVTRNQRPAGPDAVGRDQRDGLFYELTDELRLVVEIALATGRPLLLRGEPGSGKSSLAPFVARNLGWRYFEHTITGATEARDLLWTYDAVGHLSEAQVRQPGEPRPNRRDFVEPGVLWWALAPESALRRGGAPDLHADQRPQVPRSETNAERDPHRAVVLIDEIDKADASVPNALLEPLAQREFTVAETGDVISEETPEEPQQNRRLLSRLLVLLTTNEERELPPAFVRRCVVYSLSAPDTPEDWMRIAVLHFPGLAKDDADVIGIAQAIAALRKEARGANRRPPGVAEFLDAVRAFQALSPDERGFASSVVKSVTLVKDPASGD